MGLVEGSSMWERVREGVSYLKVAADDEEVEV